MRRSARAESDRYVVPWGVQTILPLLLAGSVLGAAGVLCLARFRAVLEKDPGLPAVVGILLILALSVAGGVLLVRQGVRLLGKSNPYLVIDDRGIRGGFGLIRWDEMEAVKWTGPQVDLVLTDPEEFRSRLRGWRRVVNAPYRGAVRLHLYPHSSRSAKEICQEVIARGRCVVERERLRLFGEPKIVQLFSPDGEEE